MAAFLKEAMRNLLAEDGLLVMARGLGVQRLLLKLIKLHWCAPKAAPATPNALTTRSTPQNLVFVLNASDDGHLRDALLADGVSPAHLPHSITNESGGAARAELYRGGGCFVVTSRILVVDLLTGRVPVARVNGFIVADAHRVSETSQEAFILRLFRQGNAEGFVKALSDQPDALVGGFARVERVMKALGVGKLWLSPRFHADVQAALDPLQPAVTELEVPLSPLMADVQQAVLVLLEACLNDLRRDVGRTVDVEAITLENGLLRSFDASLRSQLEPVWHKLRPPTKALVQDIKTMRLLLFYLLQYDAVTFYRFLMAVRAAASNSPGGVPPWLLSEPAQRLFSAAKRRVFEVRDGDTLHLALEGNPKWALLADVLREVPAGGTALVVVDDERTAYLLRQILVRGVQPTLRDSFGVFVRQYYSPRFGERRPAPAPAPAPASAPAGEDWARAESTSVNDLLSTEQRLLREMAVSLGGAFSSSKRRRQQQQQQDASATTADDLAKEAAATLDASVGAGGARRDEREWLKAVVAAPAGEVAVVAPAAGPGEARVAVASHDALAADPMLLRDLAPTHVVVHDPSAAFIRQLELHHAEHAETALHIYFLTYEESIEEQLYMSQLRREQDAFERLIHEKAHLVVPRGQSAGNGNAKANNNKPPQGSNTRAGGKRPRAGLGDGKAVAVDMREFRSALPSMLHAAGMTLHPVTLEVGDFVLSPDICVERKSVPDLFQSLGSGRLYNQCVAMSRYYSLPTLLIEFHPDKPFALQGAGDLGSEISVNHVSSKLVLLTRHFPNLRVVWSRSPHETVRLFAALMQDQPPVDLTKAAAAGSNERIDPDAAAAFNMVPRDVLRKIPGVTADNAHLVAQRAGTLRELAQLQEEDLRPLIGSGAKRLCGFMRASGGGKSSS